VESGPKIGPATARSVEDDTRNVELNGNRIPEWWGDFGQLKIQIKKNSIWNCTAKYLGIQIQSKSQFDFVSWDTEKFDFLDFD